ncbi:hypothetical protein Bhyg_10674, partial [Pseudolycoriella hygida]
IDKHLTQAQPIIISLLFNMSSPSPQQSVKPPSRKQRKASPQPSTSSAFNHTDLIRMMNSLTMKRRGSLSSIS